MIVNPKEEILKKKKKQESLDIDPELLSEQMRSVDNSEKDIYGEIKIHQTPEAAVLGEIEKYKEERERERGEVQVSNQSTLDDSVNANDDDDDDDDGVPLKYYGYQISKKILDNLGNSTKIDLESSDDWLKVWLARVMEKVS